MKIRLTAILMMIAGVLAILADLINIFPPRTGAYAITGAILIAGGILVLADN